MIRCAFERAWKSLEGPTPDLSLQLENKQAATANRWQYYDQKHWPYLYAIAPSQFGNFLSNRAHGYKCEIPKPHDFEASNASGPSACMVTRDAFKSKCQHFRILQCIKTGIWFEFMLGSLNQYAAY